MVEPIQPAPTEPTPAVNEPAGTPAPDNKGQNGSEPTSVQDRVNQAPAPVKPDTGSVVDDDILQDAGFDSQKWNDMLNGITDPAQRSMMEGAYNSLRKGANVKFEAAAIMRKEAEASASAPMTSERFQALIADPEFARMAQQAAKAQTDQNNSEGELTDEEWSNLTDKERKGLASMMQEQKVIKQNQVALSNMLQSQATQKEDDQLKGKYVTYDSDAVSNLQRDLINESVHATREHLFKVLDYEAAVDRAYQLGRVDERGGIVHNAEQASTQAGGTRSAAEVVPEIGEKESGPEYYKRLALWRQGQFNSRTDNQAT